MTDIQVSVIIPTFNRANRVANCIDSIIRDQSISVEVIVVDDGSTDETSSVLRLYGDAITVVRQENAGVSVARNMGLKTAKGSYVKFLDSDDALIPDSLAQQLSIANELPDRGICVGLLVGREIAISSLSVKSDSTLGLLQPRTTYQMASEALQVSQPLLPREALVEIGGFSSSSMAEDFDLFLRMHMDGWRFFDAAIPVTIFDDFVQIDRLSLSNIGVRFAGGMEMYARLVESATIWHHEEAMSLRHGLGQHLWSLGRRFARNGLDSEALTCFDWAYDLAGWRAYNANMIMKCLYPLVAPSRVERWAEKAKIVQRWTGVMPES